MISLKTSKTTQNVAAGAAGSLVVSAATVAIIRSLVPEQYRWDPSLDEAIAAVATAILTPFLSRWLAFRRDPMKEALSKSKNLRS